jgi:UDPglucose 6-dehydrogenase
MRDAPSLSIVQALIDAGASVKAYDPEGMELAAPMMPSVTMCKNANAVAEGSDAVAIVTEWDAFRALDLNRLAAVMRTPLLVDLRNIYDRATVEALGIAYDCVGRPG